MRTALLMSVSAIILFQPLAALSEEADPIQLPAMTVIANKRAQALQDVDGAITVKTAEELEQAGVTRVDDLEKVFPGLTIRNRGNRAYADLSVRGISSADFYNPSVQIFVDGMPQDQTYITQQLVNVERVEFLRGPQGTLYGRNAYGGVLNIITRQPQNRMTAELGWELSNGEQRSDLVASAPLVEGKLYGEVAMRWSKELGSIDNKSGMESEFDEGLSRQGRVKLRYAPEGGPLDVTVSAQRETLRSSDEVYVSEADLSRSSFTNTSFGSQMTYERNVNSYGLSVNYDFGGAELSSVTALQDRSMPRIMLTPSNLMGLGLASQYHYHEEQDTLSQELRLAFGEGARLSGVVGAYYQDTEFRRMQPAIAAYGMAASRNDVTTASYAAFGEATYGLTDALDLTGGLRFAREEAEVDYAGAFAFKAEDSFDDVSPKLALGYELAPRSRLYASVARGFKPGGFNHTVSNSNDRIPYNSETSINYEIGWRSSLVDGKLDLSAAAYFIQSQDKQFYVGNPGSQVLRNVGDTESRGLELDVSVYPLEGLSLTAGANIGQSTFQDARDPFTGVSYDGKTVPYAPDQTYSLSARYILPQVVLPGDLSLRGAGRYYSETFFNEANTLKQDGYGLLDASLDYETDDGLTLSLFVDNITDELYRTYSVYFGANSTDARSSLGEGRVIGVSGKMRF